MRFKKVGIHQEMPPSEKTIIAMPSVAETYPQLRARPVTVVREGMRAWPGSVAPRAGSRTNTAISSASRMPGTALTMNGMRQP